MFFHSSLTISNLFLNIETNVVDLLDLRHEKIQKIQELVEEYVDVDTICEKVS